MTAPEIGVDDQVVVKDIVEVLAERLATPDVAALLANLARTNYQMHPKVAVSWRIYNKRNKMRKRFMRVRAGFASRGRDRDWKPAHPSATECQRGYVQLRG